MGRLGLLGESVSGCSCWRPACDWSDLLSGGEAEEEREEQLMSIVGWLLRQHRVYL